MSYYFQYTKEANDFVRQQLEFVLSKLFGIISPKKPFRCINQQHNDNHPSMSIDNSGEAPHAHCFSCGAYYDTFDVCQQYYNCDEKEKFTKAYELLDVHVINTYEKFKTKVTPLSEVEKAMSISSTDIDEELRKEKEKIVDIINNSFNNMVNKKTKHFYERGLTTNIIHKYKLGVVNSMGTSMRSKFRLQKQFPYGYIIPFNDYYCQVEIGDREKIPKGCGKYM